MTRRGSASRPVSPPLTRSRPGALFAGARRRDAFADLLAVAIFVVLAMAAHGLSFTPGQILATATPFLVGLFLGWGALALSTTEPRPVRPGGLLVWAVTTVSGLGVWGLIHGKVPHWSFVLVAGIMLAILLLGRRALFGFRRS